MQVQVQAEMQAEVPAVAVEPHGGVSDDRHPHQVFPPGVEFGVGADLSAAEPLA